MSPDPTPSGIPDHGFPRVSGDEPKPTSQAVGTHPFSPRERG